MEIFSIQALSVQETGKVPSVWPQPLDLDLVTYKDGQLQPGEQTSFVAYLNSNYHRNQEL
jgi:hypothetical protein